MSERARAFYDELRHLERRARDARRVAGLVYSRRETATALKKPPYGVELDARRLTEWLSDDPAKAKVPTTAAFDKVWALVRLWAAWSGAPLPNEQRFATLLEDAQPTRRPRTDGRTAQGPGHPVRDFTDPFALEVHRPIAAPGTAPRNGGLTARLPVLPAYLERGHDTDLRKAVAQVVGGSSRLVVLVGGSSTGKTRACWEAVQTLPRDWRLWHPIDPARPQAVLDGLTALSPHTVVWLNETQHYLLTPGVDHGEKVAAGLRELLRDHDRAPVLVLGTLWPGYWSTLTAEPRDGRPDPHTQARALVTGHTLPVPSAFTIAEQGALRGSPDPRLSYAAARAEAGQTTQYLAGAPALLDRYEHAPPAARALVEAAMDVRRLGHGPAVPQAFLKAAVPGYVSDPEWEQLEDDWLEQALAYVSQPVRGAGGVVARIRRPAGDQRAPTWLSSYRLADYLEQHGTSTRRHIFPPTSFWSAALRHAGTTSDLYALAEAAKHRYRFRVAATLYARAADAGHTGALLPLARLCKEAGDQEGARQLYQRAVDAGAARDLLHRAYLLEKAGDRTAAWEAYHEAAQEGHAQAWVAMGDRWRSAGDQDRAWTMYRRAALAGNKYALKALARMARDPKAANQLYWQAALVGDEEALDALSEGNTAGAEEVFRTAARAGDTRALTLLGDLSEQAGDMEEAKRLHRQAATAGDRIASISLASLLERTGDRSAAEEVAWQEARHPDRTSTSALKVVAHHRREAGDAAGAERLLLRAADAGHRDVYGKLVQWREEAGDQEGAEQLLWEGAAAGEKHLYGDLVRRRENHGNPEGAERIARCAVGDGDTYTLAELGRMRESNGDWGNAERLYRQAADAGDWYAMAGLARLLAENGDPETAERLFALLVDQGHHEGLVELAQLRWQADAEEVRQIRRLGLEPDGTPAVWWNLESVRAAASSS